LHQELPRDQVLDTLPRATSLAGAPPWWTTWGYIRGWTHPPLYAVMLRLWRATFGEGEAASRSLSVVASLVSILLLFDAVRHLSGPRVALWAALLMSIAGSQVFYARELRNYAFAQAWALGAAAAVARIATRGRSTARTIALTICAAAALLSHYFTAFALAAIGMYGFTVLRGRARRTTLGALLGALIIAIALCLPILLKQHHDVPGRGSIAGNESGLSWQSDVEPGRVARALRRFSDLPLRLMVDLPSGYGPLAWCGIALLAIAIAIAIAIAAAVRDRRGDLFFWLLWYCSTAVILLALDLRRSTKLLEYLRYALLSGPAVCALLASISSAARSPRLAWAANAVLGLASVLIACALPLAYDKPTPDVRAVAELLDNEIRPGDVVAFYPTEGADWYAGNVWLGVSHYSRSFPWPTVILSKPADDVLLAALRGHNVWLVSGSNRRSAEQIIPGARPLRWRYVERTGTITYLMLSP
jgi:uncharacterized membrane protein